MLQFGQQQQGVVVSQNAVNAFIRHFARTIDIKSAPHSQTGHNTGRNGFRFSVVIGGGADFGVYVYLVDVGNAPGCAVGIRVWFFPDFLTAPAFSESVENRRK